jgi:nucleoside-diphosphate-sugar epimerase
MHDITDIRGKKVLITGGAGFIGHNLALKLKTLGAEPHVVDALQVNNLGYYSSGYNENQNAELYINIILERLNLLRREKVKLHIQDVREYHTISKTIDTIKPDVVVHLAAIAHANRSNKDPFSTFDHSMRTLENVLDATRSKKVHFIFFSSSMVYGNFGNKEATEDQQCNPMGIYGALKYGAEGLVKAYNQVFQLPYTIIRPSALYGERCVSRRVGQAFIENALNGLDLTINGDGTDSLDFTYIEDLIQGVVRCIAEPAAINQTFNITYGKGRQISELAEIVLKRFPDRKISKAARDSLMPERGTLSIKKAKDLIGYQPEYPIERGFEKYIEWYRGFTKKE